MRIKSNFHDKPKFFLTESADAEDAEYVPPKNDFTAVKEEDAFYSKRCFNFYLLLLLC